ncbi:glycerophosphodiester phosphodiesterase family protein [Anderseniella sp. Alg231-50]|uniref:glycerophosphodiester phosphodiesterase family protein n=1 Tax=Anderseniella sp. Alg231-50 TaxID=1922226 RepID=UPI000D55258F
MWRPTDPDCDWLTKVAIAHRGLHDVQNGVVENSLLAAEAAIEHDYAIEVDVQLSSDGEAMVFHDHSLDRLTNETGSIHDFKAADLSEISYANGSGTIPTLMQLLELVAGRVGLVVEVKSQWSGNTDLVRRTAQCLASYAGHVAVMSFDPVQVGWLAHEAPDIIRGMVADGATQDDYPWLPLSTRLSLREFRHLDVTQPNFLSLDKHWLPCPVSRMFRKTRTPMICWTIRSEQEASDALRWCDQITFEGYAPKAMV